MGEKQIGVYIGGPKKGGPRDPGKRNQSEKKKAGDPTNRNKGTAPWDVGLHRFAPAIVGRGRGAGWSARLPTQSERGGKSLRTGYEEAVRGGGVTWDNLAGKRW